MKYTHRVQYESGKGTGLHTAYLHDDHRLTLPEVWTRLEQLGAIRPKAIYDVITVENPTAADHEDR